MKVLITGGAGFLGRELVRQAVAAGNEVAATYLSGPGDADVAWHALDVRYRRDVTACVTRVQPDVVVHAAFRQRDWVTTADGAAHVAAAAAEVDARLVHVSSDAVFSGNAASYDETAVPDPVYPYGAAKAAAETAVKVMHPRAILARTSLIIGDGGSPHESFVHALAAGQHDGALFTDDLRCPVHRGDLAAALLELAASDHVGVCHVTGADGVSRYELGQLIARRDGLDAESLRRGRRTDQDIPGPVTVRLDCSATQRLLRTKLRGAREFLQDS